MHNKSSLTSSMEGAHFRKYQLSKVLIRSRPFEDKEAQRAQDDLTAGCQERTKPKPLKEPQLLSVKLCNSAAHLPSYKGYITQTQSVMGLRSEMACGGAFLQGKERETFTKGDTTANPFFCFAIKEAACFLIACTDSYLTPQ